MAKSVLLTNCLTQFLVQQIDFETKSSLTTFATTFPRNRIHSSLPIFAMLTLVHTLKSCVEAEQVLVKILLLSRIHIHKLVSRSKYLLEKWMSFFHLKNCCYTLLLGVGEARFDPIPKETESNRILMRILEVEPLVP